jgi:hypothetical protein
MVLDGHLDGILRVPRPDRQVCHSHERAEPFKAWNSQSHAEKLVGTGSLPDSKRKMLISESTTFWR